MIPRYLIFGNILLIIFLATPAQSVVEDAIPVLPENNYQYFEVANVTIFTGDEERPGDPLAFGPFTYSDITRDSFIFTVGNFPDELILNGSIAEGEKFSVYTPNGGRFSGTITSDNTSVLTFYPVNTSQHYSFTLIRMDQEYQSWGGGEFFYGESPTTYESMVDDLFMAGVSPGLSGVNQQQQNADSAWISGNTVFTEGPAISCNGEFCTCEGKTCTCTGSSCQGEGADLDKTGSGCSCTGYNCYLSCIANTDCNLAVK